MKIKFIRTNIIGIFATILWVCIIGKLLHIQVVQGKYYEEKASQQHFGSIPEPSQRGVIFDRNYKKLAVDLEYYDFYANPKHIKNSQTIVRNFSSIVGESPRRIMRKLESDKSFVYLARNVDIIRAKQLIQEEMPGIGSNKVYHRYYPYGKISGQIVGCTDIDNKPLTGIDLKFNTYLKGEDGYKYVKYDGKGRIIPDLSKDHKKPVKGNDVILTIDLQLQQICEDELEKGVREFNAKEGDVVVMNPCTGEILAVANYPNYDPNKAGNFNSEVKKVKAITDIFEPGSTFKFVTASAALEENILKPDDKIDCENGTYRVYSHYIRDTKKHGLLTFQEVFEKSSNVGTYKCALKVGKEKLYEYARNFGFGKETGVDLLGEVSGMLKVPKEWSGISIAEIPIGYEVAITSLQLICAYSAIANGGELLKPYIVRSVVDDEKVIWSSQPKVVRRVISERTASIITAFMEGVVKRGTGTNAAVENVRIAGKTGTAQKLSEDKKGYSKSDFISSFIGFFPVEDPKYIILIKLDSPKGKYYGGQVSAPIFKNIAKKILLFPQKEIAQKKYYVETQNSGYVRVPDLRNLNKDEALSISNSLNLNTIIKGFGDIVISQFPNPGADILCTESITLNVDTLRGNERLVVTPDVVGMPVRKAINELAYKGIDFKIAGTGIVVKQVPVPGKKVLKGSMSYLDCSPNYKKSP